MIKTNSRYGIFIVLLIVLNKIRPSNR